MIEYYFDIEESYMDRFFHPVKNKLQVIELLMNSIKYMLLNPSVKESDKKGSIILRIDKMSRIFFIKSDKFFSITFPFYVKKDDSYSFNFKNEMNIDHRITSEVLSLLKEDSFHSSCSLDFADKISVYQEDSCNENYWDFLKELLLMEDGYLRYDYDPKNYEKHKKSDKHPLHHYDLNYSSNATFKIGLSKRITQEDFVDFLNIKTNCKFIK